MTTLHLKKIFRTLRYTSFLIVSVVLFLEISYQIYLIDFYRSELNALNTPEERDNDSKPVILAMGDSFTADPASYVKSLRDAFPNYRVINSGVPGTCIREADLMALSRIKRFKPNVFIYQMYIGNDLYELNPPNISKEISITRRFFWWLSNKLEVIKYLNFRFRFIRQILQEEVENGTNPKDFQVFSVQNYSPRTKMMFQANPQDLENCILLKGGRKPDLMTLLYKLKRILLSLPSECEVYILVIPHCVQLNTTYQQRMIRLGAQINLSDDLLEIEYPFYKILTSEIKQKNVHFINALPNLREASSWASVYYENDPHLTPYGHSSLGREIIAVIKNNQY